MAGVEEKSGEASALEKKQRKPVGNQPGIKKEGLEWREGMEEVLTQVLETTFLTINCLSFFQPSLQSSNKAIRLLAPWQCYNAGLVSLAVTSTKRTGLKTGVYGSMGRTRTRGRQVWKVCHELVWVLFFFDDGGLWGSSQKAFVKSVERTEGLPRAMDLVLMGVAHSDVYTDFVTQVFLQRPSITKLSLPGQRAQHVRPSTTICKSFFAITSFATCGEYSTEQ